MKDLKRGDLFGKHKNYFGMRSEDSFKKITENFEKNRIHTRYKQLYKGIPVDGGELIEHFDGEYIKSITGNFIPDLEIDLKENIKAKDAIEIAKKDSKVSIFAWEDPVFEEDFKQLKEDKKATTYPNPILVINPDLKLVYRFRILGSQPFFDMIYEIDAENGKLINKFSDRMNCIGNNHDHNGTDDSMNCLANNHGHSGTIDYNDDCVKESSLPKYSKEKNALDANSGVLTDITTFTQTEQGLQPIVTEYSYGKHRLITNNFSSKIETRKWNALINFPESDNDSENTPWSSLNAITMDQPSNIVNWHTDHRLQTETHWTVSQAWNYFANYHGTYIGAGNGTIRVRSKIEVKNAYYLPFDGSLNFGFWINPATKFTPEKSTDFVSIDAAGHELTHKFIHDRLNLSAGSIPSVEGRAITESFCDIYGTMAERTLRPGGGNWLMYDELQTGGLRNLLNPSQSVYLGAQPEIYKGANWDFDPINSGHKNGGVQNKWFTLLSLGSLGVPFNGQTINGIGETKAMQIVHHCINNYLSGTSIYVNSAIGLILSAEDLFGRCSPEHLATQQAWAAVGIGQVRNCFQWQEVASICSQETNLPVSVIFNTNLSSPLTWTPLNYISFSGQTYNATTWTTSVSGLNNNTLTISDIPSNTPIGGYYYFNVYGSGGSFSMPFQVVSCPTQKAIDYTNEEYHIKEDEVTNTSEDASIFQNLLSNETKFYPNPVSDVLIVDIGKNESKDGSIKIYDIYGILIRQLEYKSSSIDVTELNDGIYLIKTSTGNKSSYAKFIKKN